MGKQALLQTNLNAGELSPMLEGRIDVGKYGVGLKVCENFVPTVQGPITNRAGTRYVSEVKSSANRTWLVPFVFSATDGWVLEFGDGYIRFYTNRGQVLSGVSAFEIVSPYVQGDLFNSDGSFAISYAQSADVVYLAHKNYAPRKLSRRSNLVWELSVVEFDPHPFKDVNTDKGVVVVTSAETGSITISSNAPLFDSSQVGTLFFIESAPSSSYIPWEAGKSITIGNERRSDGNIYKATSAGTTAGVKPTHTEGIKSDGAVSWEYMHSGYGWAEITVVDSPVSVSATVVRQFPSTLVTTLTSPTSSNTSITAWEYGSSVSNATSKMVVTTSSSHGYTTGEKLKISGMPTSFVLTNSQMGESDSYSMTANGVFEIVVESSVKFSYRPLNAPISILTSFSGSGSATAAASKYTSTSVVASSSYKWAKSAWNVTDGYPTHVTFFRERLTFARDNRIWMSVSGDYENFSSKDGDLVTADMAIDIQLVSSMVNNITWLSASTNLIIGTTGTEFMVGEMSSSEPLGPDNIKASPQGNYGSRGVQGLRIGESILFIQRAGRKVREIKYSFEADAYVSTDVTVLADHITQGGIVSWDYAQEPDSVVWAARADGTLLGFTFNREQDVIGWSRHKLGGSGIVECVVSIPSPDASKDDVWMIVRRTIDGATKRYVEYITERYETGDDVADCLYLDCGATYSGAAAATISGLDHLEGMTVGVLADGSVHPDRVVDGGAITLQRSVTKAQIGLKYSPVMQSMRIEGGSQNGTSQGKTKRISKVNVRFKDTLNALAGPSVDKLDRITFRRGSDHMDSAPPLFSGDKDIPWPHGYDKDGYVTIKQDQPLPMTIVAIMPTVSTSD